MAFNPHLKSLRHVWLISIKQIYFSFSKEMNETQILINSEFLSSKSQIHILPCKIYFNGVTDVKSFFSSSITKPLSFKKEIDEKKKVEGIQNKFLNSIKI